VTLSEITLRIAKLRHDKKYTNDVVHLLALLTEEVGELAQAIKPLWSEHYGTADIANIQRELCDCLIVLLAIASAKNIDVERALEMRVSERLGLLDDC
jgi:NTP pyrophosphatase (non-canonical NTP hydrolase)